jgi:hypothetical protein
MWVINAHSSSVRGTSEPDANSESDLESLVKFRLNYWSYSESDLRPEIDAC